MVGVTKRRLMVVVNVEGVARGAAFAATQGENKRENTGTVTKLALTG